jgi:hypothetical protein
MGRVCKEAEDAAVAACNGIACNEFTNCNGIQCNSFTGCSWWNVPCHVARAACVVAMAIARAACWVARGVCVLAAEAVKAACMIAAAVARAACELVNFVLDIVAFVVELILSIPILGGIIRTIWNWVTEIVWRAFGLVDFFLSWAGIRFRKKMYFGVIVPSVDGVVIASDADIMNQVNAASTFYDTTCNINMIFSGICHTDVPPPEGGLTVSCDATGFFNDWWLPGSYFEFASATCKFTDGFRRVIGYGAEIIIFIVRNVTPDTGGSNTRGCSFSSTHNYVVVEAGPAVSNFMASHEMGHACWLPHDSGTNLMNGTVPFTNPTLSALQIATIRWSKHCVYI